LLGIKVDDGFILACGQQICKKRGRLKMETTGENADFPLCEKTVKNYLQHIENI